MPHLVELISCSQAASATARYSEDWGAGLLGRWQGPEPTMTILMQGRVSVLHHYRSTNCCVLLGLLSVRTLGGLGTIQPIS